MKDACRPRSPPSFSLELVIQSAGLTCCPACSRPWNMWELDCTVARSSPGVLPAAGRLPFEAQGPCSVPLSTPACTQRTAGATAGTERPALEGLGQTSLDTKCSVRNGTSSSTSSCASSAGRTAAGRTPLTRFRSTWQHAPCFRLRFFVRTALASQAQAFLRAGCYQHYYSMLAIQEESVLTPHKNVRLLQHPALQSPHPLPES